jgi:hypothetical protein
MSPLLGLYCIGAIVAGIIEGHYQYGRFKNRAQLGLSTSEAVQEAAFYVLGTAISWPPVAAFWLLMVLIFKLWDLYVAWKR